MKLSTFQHLSALLTTKHRIESDFAKLEDADREDLSTICVDLVWVEYPNNRHYQLFQSDGSPRLWADDSLHKGFADELRTLVRKFLLADLQSCHEAIEALGIEIDEV